MNYLAHAFLSFNEPEILVGNMISDFVKGRKKFDFNDNIRKGIDLHRAIDTFTDYHEATQIAKLIFRPAYRLYAGAFIDIAYDHYLANDINQFENKETLMKFSTACYAQLQNYKQLLPAPFSMMFPYMQKHNWLFNYRYREGIQNSFEGLVRRAQYMSDSKTAFILFERHYEEIKSCYNNFFPSLKKFAFNHLQLLNGK
jgi:acyl carrier protein phosphodiesterase